MILDMQQYNENKHAKQYHRGVSCQVNGTIKKWKTERKKGGNVGFALILRHIMDISVQYVENYFLILC